MGKRLVIIDGNSLINRAYYAMQRPMITKKGVYTQGIFGFMNMLYKILDDHKPQYMAVAWDRKAPTFRHEAYEDYKAGRKKMPPELAMELPIMKDILDAMSIRNLEIDGFEADDIIGTVARTAEREGLEPLIITGDKDALQLATETTNILITKRGISEFELYDKEKMLERYELTPEQFIELKGLMGDSSDNIPGIPGVGEKTGIKLLKQFGNIQNLLAHTDEIKGKKLREKVEENAQLAVMSRKLAEICTEVPIDFDVEDLKIEEPDYGRIVDLFTELEFNTFLKRLNAGGIDLGLNDDLEPEYEQIRISDPEELVLLDAVENGSSVVIRIFGNNDHVAAPKNEGAALICGGRYYYVDLRNAGTEAGFIDFLNRKKLRFVGHDLIMAYYPLMMKGLREIETEFDTQVAQYVLDPSRSDYSLKILALEVLHKDIQSEKDFLKNNAQTDLLGSDADAYMEYGLEWCRTVHVLSGRQREMLEKKELETLCREIEFPLIEVLSAMEMNGVDTDAAVLDSAGADLSVEISGIESEIYELAGETFNINSPVQLGKILFDKMGLPAGKKTKTGYSTSADVLEKIRDRNPIVDLVLKYRTFTKLRSTYIEGMKPLISPEGKIHAHFQQTVAATGRLSCTEPNLQNIPVRQEIGRRLRKAFVAGEGHVLIGADYSQIELRILAQLSGDENLISSFNNGEDIHRSTAARVFDLDSDEVTPLDRSRAKAVNFGIIYGMSGFGLSENIHVSRKEAEHYISEYFAAHPRVRAYMDECIRECREKGYSSTVFGRKRYIHEISSSNYMTRQLGERLAMNSPIQGTAADIIKIAMNKVYNELKNRNMKSKLILQIHDELIICADEGEIGEVSELLKRNMESAADFDVELLCDMKTGSSWFDLKD